MHQITKDITNKLVKQLPEGRDFYSLDDLYDAELPASVIERIRLELNRNLVESLQDPGTEWADTGDEGARLAWNQYLDALRLRLRLPAAFLTQVIETAVEEVLAQMCAPRQFLPDFVYGDDNVLSAEELENRSARVIVYPHFGVVGPKYMHKKELDELTKDQFADLIARVDARFTHGYSTLNWAQVLEPLFEIGGGNIPPELLEAFFADKELDELAKRFTGVTEDVDEQKLIEILSLPEYDFDDIPYVKPAAELQPETDSETEVETEPETESDIEAEIEPEEEDKPQDESIDRPEGKSETDEIVEEDEEPEITDSEANNTAEPDEEPEEGPEEKAPESPVYKMKSAELNGDDEPEEVTDSDEDSEDEVENEEDEEPIFSRYKSFDLDVEEGITEEDSESVSMEEQEEVVPMWKKFAREDDEAFPVKKIESDIPDEEAESYQRIQQFEEPEEDETGLEELEKQLNDAAPAFIRHLFKGDKNAYKNAVEVLASFKNWREAGKYLTNEIFRRSSIDMYSDTAVDFTDRLHKFFLDRERRI